MILQSPGDVAFTLFKMPVYFYGIILAFACLAGVFTAYKLLKNYSGETNPDCIWDISPLVLIAGILGARLYYCILNFSYYFSNPIEIFNIREGGLSIHGGIIAGIIALFFASRKCKIHFLKILDVFAVGTIFAQAIGRWGNFFNSEAFGFPYDGILKLYIPSADRPAMFVNFEYFHPAFLYESILDLIIFVILFFIYKKYAVKSPGVALSIYLMLYSLVRLFTEYIRIDSALDVSGVPVAQIVSIIVFIISAVLLIFLIKKSSNETNS